MRNVFVVSCSLVLGAVLASRSDTQTAQAPVPTPSATLKSSSRHYPPRPTGPLPLPPYPIPFPYPFTGFPAVTAVNDEPRTPVPISTEATATETPDPTAADVPVPTTEPKAPEEAAPVATSETPATPPPAAAKTTSPRTPGAATTPAPTLYVAPPIPTASVDSETFQKVDNVVCGDDVVHTIYTVYTKNRALFDMCADKSKYQIFPFSGTSPTPTQIYDLATSDACTVLFTACVVARLPTCDTSSMDLKAVTESLLKVTMDIEHGRPSPDTKRFHEMHVWRRDSNLAKEAGVPFGNDSALYAEYTRDVAAALDKYSVQVKPDLTIVFNETITNSGGHSYFFNKTSGSIDEVIGGVHGADMSGSLDEVKTTPPTAVEVLSAAPSIMARGHAIALSVILLVCGVALF